MAAAHDAVSLRSMTPDDTEAEAEASIAPSGQAFRSHLQRYAFRSTPSRDHTASTRAAPEMEDDSFVSSEDALTSASQGAVKVNESTTVTESKHPSTSRKRPSSSQASTTSVKKAKGKAAPLNIENKLVDSVRPGLVLIMIGVNPGKTTALTGHAYSHKSNRYWPTMHASGVTPILHKPEETSTLQDLYGIGHTNIVARATITEADIHHHEFIEGAAILDEKIRTNRPEAVAIVGKGIWLKFLEWKTGTRSKAALEKLFKYGWQDEEFWIGRTLDEQSGEVTWTGARTIVVATTSGAAAQFAANGGAERLRRWKPLGEWFTPKRQEWVQRRVDAGNEQHGL